MSRILWAALTACLTLSIVTLNAAERDGARARLTCVNNLKHVGLALHNYHEVNRTFPAVANYDKDGKPLLSWRVHVLPYLEQEDLYKQFHLDEPWDSDHNKTLIEKMPKVFACSVHDLAMKGKTTYLAPHGMGLAFEADRALKIATFIDGTSNTILVVEANDDQAVIWTKPADLEIDLDKPNAGLGAGHSAGFNALYCDGSVRFIPSEIKPDTLKLLLQRNDRQVVPEF